MSDDQTVARKKRLAAALKDNLKRRKAQAKARGSASERRGETGAAAPALPGKGQNVDTKG